LKIAASTAVRGTPTLGTADRALFESSHCGTHRGRPVPHLPLRSRSHVTRLARRSFHKDAASNLNHPQSTAHIKNGCIARSATIASRKIDALRCATLSAR